MTSTSRRITIAAFLVLVFGTALALRVAPVWSEVFRDGRVVFAENDPWIHMRNAENIAAHWPMPGWYDPYRLAPEGQWTEAPLMDVAVAGIALATPLSIDTAGAWFPAVCGALVVIPLFFLMRLVFGTAEGIVAALLIAILPGSLFLRSRLGVADHHVLEVLLAVCVLLFLARAVESRVDRDAVLAGLFLGLYLLAWSRGAFLLLILLAWAMIEGAAGRRVARIIGVTFGVALLIGAPVALFLPPMRLSIAVLAAGAVVVFAGERLPRTWVPLFGLAALVAATVAFPELLQQFRRFVPSGGAATIGEVKPFLVLDGRFSLRPLWMELTTASVLAVIGVGITLRERTPSRLLLLVWSAVVTAATMLQGRFAYEMAVAAAMFAAVAAARLLWRGLRPSFAALAIAAIVVYPNVARLRVSAYAPLYGPSAEWLDTLEWMRKETPEPFGSPAVFFGRYTKENAPRAQYSVMAWSDYGWWVARIARRPPATNPTHVAVKEAARFYTATTETEALRILSGRNARYVIADRSMPMTVAGAGRIQSSQLEPMATWAERDPAAYFELVRENGRPLFLYTPAYYRTMAVRLFGYDGRAYTPSHTSWAVAVDAQKNVIGRRRFATYEDAASFVAANRKWRLAGLHPLASCVPLQALQRFHAVHVSPSHEVKVFEVKE